MTNPNAHTISPSKAILINEAAAVTGVSARKINRLIDDAVLPKSVCIKLGSRRAVRAYAVPMVSFGASDGSKLSKGMRLEAMRMIEKFAKNNWPRLRDEPEHAKVLRFESGCVILSLGEPVSAAMAGLNRLNDAFHRIIEDQDVRGGVPVVRGTRISVYEVADALAIDGLETTLEDFPALSREDVEASALYVTARPRTGRPRASTKPRRFVSEETVDLAGAH
ncbi:DUF433 domain-containing protein [uncultured Tateyamaria sp.]|uniref:DUF433 domain-containing protein n=1 Tax=uncultured Tateyamaria sp. TaxID=455651 RepID=UPI0026139413|nr:DUF433 domain-containing protein [uncultured Tateyamaria sp.]